jgi:hypothetical protein
LICPVAIVVGGFSVPVSIVTDARAGVADGAMIEGGGVAQPASQTTNPMAKIRFMPTPFPIRFRRAAGYRTRRHDCSSASPTARHSIRLLRHNEIVAMQALDLVRPPGDRDFAPLGQSCRVMSFRFCNLGDLVRERDGIDKIFELEHALQPFDIFALHNLPFVPHGYFRVGGGWLAAATRDAF